MAATTGPSRTDSNASTQPVRLRSGQAHWSLQNRRTAMSCRGLVVARQLVLFSLDSMGWAVAFRLGGVSIVSTVEPHFPLPEKLWLAVDEVVHHDDVMAGIVARPRGNVAGLDPDRRNTRVGKHNAEEGQVSTARRSRYGTGE